MNIDESKLSSSELASDWFRANPLFVNPSNLLAMPLHPNAQRGADVSLLPFTICPNSNKSLTLHS